MHIAQSSLIWISSCHPYIQPLHPIPRHARTFFSFPVYILATRKQSYRRPGKLGTSLRFGYFVEHPNSPIETNEVVRSSTTWHVDSLAGFGERKEEFVSDTRAIRTLVPMNLLVDQVYTTPQSVRPASFPARCFGTAPPLGIIRSRANTKRRSARAVMFEEFIVCGVVTAGFLMTRNCRS
jgi:hypothetical protein